MPQNSNANKNKTKGLVLMICLAIMFVFMPGCGIFNKNPGNTSTQDGQTDKIPKQLEELESTIEEIFIALDGPAIIDQDQEQRQSGQGQKQQSSPKDQEQQSTETGKGQQESGQSKQDQGGAESSNQTSQEKPQTKNPWEQVTQSIQTLHLNWNEYMPQITKKGGTKEILDGFSNSLNALTKIAEDRNKEKTLLAANQVYSQIAGIHSLYKTKTSPELKRISYYSRNSMLTSYTADWTRASSDLEEVKTRWSIVKSSVGKEAEEDSSKLDLSIYELEKVIKEKNAELIEIKGKITLQNIQDLQKAIEKK